MRKVNPQEYLSSHGKLPKGRGLWAFCVHPSHGYEPFIFNGSYTEAKAAALKHFPRNLEVTVLP